MALAGGAVVGLGAVVAFGPVVRGEAEAVAARYGGTIEIGRVVPVWRGVRLEGVQVTLTEVPSVRLSFESVTVQYDVDGRAVTLGGGLVEAVGGWQTVHAQAEAWRSRHLERSGEGGPTGNRFVVEDLGISWKSRSEGASDQAKLDGVRFERGEDGTSISSKRAEITLGPAQLEVSEGRVRLTRGEAGYQLKELAAHAILAELDLSGGNALSAVEGVALEASSSGSSPGERARALAIALAHEVDARLAPDAEVRLRGLSAHLRRGEERLNLGPGTFVVRRVDGEMSFELMPELGPEEVKDKSLTFALRVPVKGGERPIRASISGGPIFLSSLGVREGDFGLMDVGESALETRAEVELSADGKILAFSGDGTVRALSLQNDAIAADPVRGVDLSWRGKGNLSLDGTRVMVESGELQLGEVRLQGRGTYERVSRGTESGFAVRGELELPLTACQALLDAAPEGLIPVVKGMRMAGTFSLKGHARFDTTSLDRDYDVDWVSTNSCRITEVPPRIDVTRFRSPFKRAAYDGKGIEKEVESGPGTPGWTPYRSISRYMEVAVLGCEDGRFLHHHGFDAEAIENSIRENLRSGKFVRGASTISMQLAKNLYLKRHKTLSRKLQEAFLTMYLEQELTKEQIMELYLNVVEFAPDVYGIGPAASHYFNSSPSRLSLGQSMYLASILPSPKVQHFGAGGAVSPGWMRYLHTLMRHAHKRHRITDEELEEGLAETVVFGSPSPRRAPSGDVSDPGVEDLQPWEEDPGGWVAP